MDDCIKCLSSTSISSDECFRCFFYHYMFRILQIELERMKGIKIGPIIPDPRPGPDPSPVINLGEYEGKLVRAFAGDPNPQPNVFNPKLQLRVAKEFKKALAATSGKVDREIARLEQIQK